MRAFRIALAVLVTLVGGALGSSGAPRATYASASTQDAVTLPIGFEPNVGQAGSWARFVARTGDGDVAFTTQGAVLRASTGSMPLRMGLAGARPTEPQSLTRLPGVVNYLVGDDPSGWVTNVPTYAGVRYDYPGVRLDFHGTAGSLEYDVVVAPGTDPSAVGLAFFGADGLTIAPDGSLVVRLAGADLWQGKPAIYQVIDGVRRPVAGGFRILATDLVGFSVGAYDPMAALVIDPVISYSTFLGGEHSDLANGIAVDDQGNVYVTGQTDSAHFPRVNAFDSTIGGGTCGFGFPCRDGFVTKLDATGAVAYSTYLGGSSDDFGLAIAVDDAGSAYVTGNTASTNFPTKGAFQDTFGGGSCSEIACKGDAFVTKFSSTGSLVYSTYVGDTGVEEGLGIAVGPDGSAFIAGYTDSDQFPVQNAFRPAKTGFWDGFVTKVASDGGSLVYSTFLGGNETGFDRLEGANAIAVDAAGAAYVTGLTSAQDFPTKNALQPTCAGDCFSSRADAFVTKFRPNGQALVYSTYLGGFTDLGSQGHEFGNAIAVDSRKRVYVAGFTSSENFPTTTGAFQENFGGSPDGVNGDAFVAKFRRSGASLVYASYLGGQGGDIGYGIGVDGHGTAFVTGLTDSDDFPTKLSLQDGVLGSNDAFVTRVGALGGRLRYSTFLGGSTGLIGIDVATAVAVDGGVAYVTGWTEADDFPIVNASQPDLAGEYDSFVTKILPH